MTQTLADISRASTTEISLFDGDERTPDGCFTAAATILGIPTQYTLRGEPGDMTAGIVSRIEIHRHRATRYIGGRLKGGTYAGSA
ncbi:hypothetical protein SAMN04488590_3023 [Microbacterium sp. 77mftsu3.1]|nr:hypothetical protein SAMN04488590_3023 [Microbacterium sp. 77mftsu3.1]